MANEELNQVEIEKLEKEYNELIMQRRQKLEELKKNDQDPFEIVKYDRTHTSKDIKDNYEELEGKDVRVAGRLMSKRVHGKAGFSDIHDRYGKLQIYMKIDDVGEEKLKFFKTLDLGDIIGVEGKVFKTKTGEISVHVNDFVLLTKSLKPLPEKWHGLKDPDLRYRQRYVDLIMNPEVRDTFYKRTQIIRAIRRFLDDRNYIEVETPILSTIASGAAARPFPTHSNALDIDLYLRIATELYLKRLIVGGFERVYEIGKDFRNEGIDIRHNPEFTMIELYEAYTDYNGMMELMENMCAYCCTEVNGTTKATYQGTEIDFKPPWRRLTMHDAVKQYAGVDFDDIKTDEEAREVVKKQLPKVQDELKKKLTDCSKGDLLNAAFEAYAEEHLVQPTFILDYPIEVSPLTKRKKGHPELTERFEAFVFARELGNAYSELNDPIDQLGRFQQQANERELGDDEAYAMDDDFVNALEIGMPPTGGLGIGIDRLIMFLTDAYSIRDVLLFPTMKPENK
jgi:lysyl-tRNA synthetase class 2